MKDPKKIAAKQVRRAQEASTDYVEGVQGVTEAPGAKAVRKQDKLKQNFNASVDSGKWADATKAVSRDDWVQATVSKGGARYAAGVEEAKGKIEAFQEDLQSFLASTQSEIDNMPDATPEQRKAKMVANFDRMRKFKRRTRRR